MTLKEKLLTETMTIDEVARAGKCTVRHVQDEIKRGHIRGSKPGRAWVFLPEEVEKWIKRKSAS